MLGIVSSPWRSLTYVEVSAKQDGKFIRRKWLLPGEQVASGETRDRE